MANKRMFSKEVTNCDDFLEMPAGSQMLYLHLNMNADDDGFVQPKSIMRLCQSKDDELKILILKGFVILFDNMMIVITHWKLNNDLKIDRYKPTIYQELLKQLSLNKNKTYNKINNLQFLETKCIQNGDKMYPKWIPSIVENSIVENSIVENSIVKKEQKLKQKKTAGHPSPAIADSVLVDAIAIDQSTEAMPQSSQALPLVGQSLQSNQKENIPQLLVDHYNKQTSRHFTLTKDLLKNINQVLKSYSYEECTEVIDYIVTNQWYIDNQQDTLSVIFRVTKFHEKLEKSQLIRNSSKPNQGRFLPNGQFETLSGNLIFQDAETGAPPPMDWILDRFEIVEDLRDLS